MDEKEFLKTTTDILAPLVQIVDDLKRCLLSRNRRGLKEIEKRVVAATMSSLPLFEELVQKGQKTAVDEKSVNFLPVLQKLGIGTGDLLSGIRTALETEVPLTDKALAEISEIMALTKDLARDTGDALTTGNGNFRQYAITSAANLLKRADECALDHQQRLITGRCTPKSSFVYLDIMQSLRRTARELASLCETD